MPEAKKKHVFSNHKSIPFSGRYVPLSAQVELNDANCQTENRLQHGLNYPTIGQEFYNFSCGIRTVQKFWQLLNEVQLKKTGLETGLKTFTFYDLRWFICSSLSPSFCFFFLSGLLLLF